MALLTGTPRPPSYPCGRYIRTNPLRREFGLRLLTDPMTEPLRIILIRAWRRPARFDTNQEFQSVHRQRPTQAELLAASPRSLGWLILTELIVSRHIVEAPMSSISRQTRNRLLNDQGAYLHALYIALSTQLGSEAAIAQFQQAIDTPQQNRIN